MNDDARQEDAVAGSMSTIWEMCKPDHFYYEVIEFTRGILIAGVVVLIFPNTVAQVGIALMIAASFMVLSKMVVAPYESLWDAWVNRIGHAIVFGSIYLALILMANVADEREGIKRVFEVVLIAGHAFILLLVVLEGATVTCLWMKRSS